MHDTIIIGGGPAGLTAGLYLSRAGYKVLVIEKESIGGQISKSSVVENYPGCKNISGMDFASNLYQQVESFGGEFEFGEVTKVECGKTYKVSTDYNTFEAKSIILATGVKHNLLGLNNEEELLGNGLHVCATCDGAFYKGKEVAVIGGANTAAQDALFLSSLASRVYMIYRKDELRCESILKARIEEKDNIELLYNTIVSSIDKDDKMVLHLEGDENKTLEVDGVFLAIGMKPNSNLLSDVIDLDEDGYYDARDLKTKIPGVFIAGDCRSKSIRQLTTATSDGTIAAMEAISYLKSL